MKIIIEEVLSKIDILATSALALVTALAWNSAFQQYFNSKPSLKKYGLWIYAILITLISVGAMFLLTQIKKVKKEKINNY